MKNKTGYIYRICNIVNGRCYYGQTINFNRRITTHKRHLNKNIHQNEHLQRAWNIYGENKFIYELVETVKDISNLDKREQFYLNLNINGYNIAKDARCPMLGRKQSENCKKIVSAIHKGKITSDEVKQKIREKLIGMNVGKKYNQEQINNMIIAQKGNIKNLKRLKTLYRDMPQNMKDKRNKKISDSKKGMTFSDTHKRNLSIAKNIYIQKKRGDYIENNRFCSQTFNA